MISTSVLLCQENQVAFDNEGKIFVIDSKLNQSLHIFDEYQDFIEARLYQLADLSFSLEVQYKVDQQLLRKKLTMSSEEVSLFKTKVDQRIADAKSKTIDQSGRTELLWGHTLAGLGIYGPAAVNITDVDGTLAVGMYMITAAASFIIPYAITNYSPVSSGAARLSVWGAYSGAAHGILLYDLFGITGTLIEYPEDFPGEFTTTTTDYQAYWGLVALTSIAESIAGYYIAQNNGFSEGKSDLMISTSVASTGVLPGIAYLAGVEDSKALSGAALIGTFSGYALGNFISNTQNYSRGDATCFTNLWVMGTAVPVSILAAAKSEEPKNYVGGAILGAGIGMWLADNLLKGKDFSTSQGVYMSLASFGGAFVTGGISFLAIGNNDNGIEFIPAIMTLGAIGGFTIAYTAFADDAKDGDTKVSSNIKLDFNPMALTSAFSNGVAINPMNYYYNPLLSFSYKF